MGSKCILRGSLFLDNVRVPAANLVTSHAAYQQALAAHQGRKETDMWPITGYNAVKFLAAAIEAAGTTEPTAVAAALDGLTIQTPLGEITVDPETNRANSPEFYGRFEPQEGSDVARMTDLRLVRFPG